MKQATAQPLSLLIHTEKPGETPRLVKLQAFSGAYRIVAGWQGLAWANLWVSLVSGFGSFWQYLVDSSWDAVKVSPTPGPDWLLPSVAVEKPQGKGLRGTNINLEGRRAGDPRRKICPWLFGGVTSLFGGQVLLLFVQ